MEKYKGIGLLVLEGREQPVPVYISLSMHPASGGVHLKWYGDVRIADRRDAGVVAARSGYHTNLVLGDGRRVRVLVTQAGHDHMTFIGDEPLPAESPAPPQRWCDVLIVEDDVAVAKVLERQLRQAGFSTCICLNGAECLMALLELRPRLVLLDLLLPDLRGWQLLQNMRMHPGLKDVPIVVLTAVEEAQSTPRFGPYAPDAYLRKPIETHQVVDKVRQFIEPGEPQPSASGES